MAEYFYELGILDTKEYTECSASDLIAQFVGQSAPKTRNVLRSALGRVLFVDEAYRLRDGEFGKEAVNELVDCLTKPQFMGRIVVILAGYSEDINALLRINPGLSSRFPEEVIFENMDPEQCITLLDRQLRQSEVEVPSDLRVTDSEQYCQLSVCFRQLSMLPSWGNGRDVKTLAKSITAAAFEHADPASSSVIVTMADILPASMGMLQDLSVRSQVRGGTTDRLVNAVSESLTQSLAANPPPLVDIPNVTTISKDVADVMPRPKKEINRLLKLASSSTRDPGVSDEIWHQLQMDIAAEEAAAAAMRKKIADEERAVQSLRENEESSSQNLRNLEKDIAERAHDLDREKMEGIKREREEERLRMLAIKRAREEAEQKMRKALEEEQRKREEEARAQKKLKEMGVCPMGFHWVKQDSGYRCLGGSHFVSNDALGM
jgi:hypothetical protein